MNVRLISITKPCIEVPEEEKRVGDPVYKQLTAEQLIVYTARVSNPSNQHNHETADKLVRYLIKNKHWSPFEMASMCVEIKTSRAIAQQILRHRSFSFQEFSQRYAKVVDMEPVQLRKQADKNRQSSSVEFDPEINVVQAWGTGSEERPALINIKASVLIDQHLIRCQKLYDDLIDAGVAKECARTVLPLTTQTTIYMNGTVRSWVHYLQQRLDPHTQLEHREVAMEIWKLFREKFPNISEAVFGDHPELQF